MQLDEVKLIFEYTQWIGQNILQQTRLVSEEEYTAKTAYGIGFQSLRGTLVHLVDTVYGWRLICEGHFSQSGTQADYDATGIDESMLPTREALVARWHEEYQAMTDYIHSLDQARLDGVVHYVIPENIVRERPLWHVLYHVVNHATQHLSEAAALLTIYGHSPGDIDFTRFMNERTKHS